MENSPCDLPFQKFRHDKFLTLNVLMNIEHEEAYKFMFGVNNKTRTFLEHNFITIRNGFINEGLITYYIRTDFNHYSIFEKLYV